MAPCLDLGATTNLFTGELTKKKGATEETNIYNYKLMNAYKKPVKISGLTVINIRHILGQWIVIGCIVCL